jgi:hypothetical protein
MQIVSWMPLGFGKNSGYISRYPQTERSPMLIPIKEFHEKRNSLNEPDLKLPEDANFFDRVTELLKSTPLSPVIDQG